jgi:HlyD family secretion protein
MSAFPSSPPSSPPEQEIAAVRSTQEPERPPRWPIYVFAAVVLGVSAWFLRPRPQVKTAAPPVPTARVHRGRIDPALRIGGSISATRFVNVAAPVLQAPDQGRGLTLTYVAQSGARVRKGQLIAQIDDQDIRDHLDDVVASIAQSELDIKRRKAQLVAQMENLKQGLRVAKVAWEKAKLDAIAIPVRNVMLQESLRLAEEEYKLAYEEAVKQMPLTEERQLADLKLYELSYEHDIRHRDRHMLDSRRCKIEAPMDGMVVMQTTYRGGEMNQIKVGDQLAPGQPFMRVVDPRSMQLDAMMSQAESQMVHLGQHATVHFDAFPDIEVEGRVQSVGAFAMGSRRVNYYIRRIPVRVRIETSDARVIPDLSASADVSTAAETDGLIVPREALNEAEGKTVVYVKEGDNFLPHQVDVAGTTNTEAAVRSGVEEGQEVALQPPPGVVR